MPALNLLVLRCRDLEAARTFYELFGYRFAKHAHGSGPEHYAHEGDAFVLELYPASSPTSGDMTGLGIAVPSLPEAHARLSEAGCAPAAIRDNPWGRSFVARDPDGRRVEVTEAR